MSRQFLCIAILLNFYLASQEMLFVKTYLVRELICFLYTYKCFEDTGGLTRGSRRERIIGKFIENEFEKVDRLMELYMRHALVMFHLFLSTLPTGLH